MIYADLHDGTKQFRHFFPDLGQIESFDIVKRLVRKQFGSIELITIGCVPDEKVHTWTPPSPPDDYQVKNMRRVKFAFGRKAKPVAVKARPDDFEDD